MLHNYRIILDGKLEQVVDIGSLAQIQQDHIDFVDPNFDVSRLSVHPDDLKIDADRRAVAFAASARDAIVQEPDALRRDGWTMKGLGAMFFLQAKAPEAFEQVLAGVESAFSAEAERRGQGESSVELMQASTTEFLKMLYSTSLVEGNLRGLQKAMDAAEPEQLDAILAGAKEAADADMVLLMAGTS